ncbi:hypothetical protein GE09DRAFT_1035118 [Coniochaeta sp. 2T2.1]|nr:hypothetical protein GE09DRAFT_1035118 [Coniochaeta sp. 2T2.1]
MSPIMPGRIPLPVVNSPEKVQLARLSHVYVSHPNLEDFEEFAKNFGFIEEAREEGVIYYRGYGKDMCCYVATRSTDGKRHFEGAAYVAKTEADFLKAAALPGSSPTKVNHGPCGGQHTSLSSPSGTKIHVLWGVNERPVLPVSATAIQKGATNTALDKHRKAGTFQRFKIGPAMVHKLGHYGFITSKFDDDFLFYTQKFNFCPSDVLYEEVNGEQVDSLTFMHLDQGQEYSDHHTLFLSRAPPNFQEAHKVHHCSFEVEDIDTQLLGHEYLLSKGYSPIWGVGRHIYGSQIFDYWKDTSGFAIEHYADGDMVNTDNPTGRDKSDGPASMYIWGPVRPEGGVHHRLMGMDTSTSTDSTSRKHHQNGLVLMPKNFLEIERPATVVIVGAGPSGLALGALLGRMGTRVIILERDTEVCEDPRGIVVNGDAVRISYQVGIGEGLTKRIGKDIGILNFHRGNFRVPPFMTFDINVDWAQQSVSNNVTQFQPNYEREIRALLKDFPSCKLRTGCEVLRRTQDGDKTVVGYRDQSGTDHCIRTSWLVGADGKRGVVRKKFLEPEGIKQEDGPWTYVGTWVATNLKITTPTPESHPKFPLWKLGYTPQQIHDAFWPSGFHFCNDSQRPSVSGRFGPAGSGFWRHEYSVEPTDNLEDVEGQFWELFGPWMVVQGSKFSRGLGNVEFPRDCIEVIRCRPFTFATKIVNRWYSNNTMLIGDAAHVFPPFGGQGIATGIRDAQALAWRLTVMSRLNLGLHTREKILRGWSQERRHAWNAAMQATKLNGSIVNERSLLGGLLYRTWMRVLWWFPTIAHYKTHQAFRDKLVFSQETCPDGFFLGDAGGGQKIAQVWVRQPGCKPQLSDSAFLRDLSGLSLLVLVTEQSWINRQDIARLLEEADLPDGLLRVENVSFYQLDGDNARTAYYPCSADDLVREGIKPIQGYACTAVEDRLGHGVRLVLLRPDFYVHSVAASIEEMAENLRKVKEYFG